MERNSRIEQFYAAIYSVWAPIVQTAIEREMKDTTRNKDCDFKELEVLHKCDTAIKQSGHRIDRVTGAETEASRIYAAKKAQVMGQAREVYAD
jgi:hypothetical protein